MKNRLFLLFGAILSAIILSSCGDVIEEPYVYQKPLDTTKTTNQKVLLEDYTGFTCGNCPAAHELAAEIAKTYSGKVIIMAVHAGGYAKTSPAHSYDFKTASGTIYDDFFGISKVGNPNGMINRKGYAEGAKNHILPKTKWQKQVDSALAKVAKIELTLKSTYNESTKTTKIDVTINYLGAGSKDLNLDLYLTEDSIINYQTDYRLTPPDNPAYAHMHVLRDTPLGTWGELISSTDVPAGTKISKSYNYTIASDKDFVPKNMHIIAAIHNIKTYEIVQVEEVSLK